MRVQVAVARLNEWDDEWAALAARARGLLDTHKDEWRAKVPKR